ncbi:MAG: patatin-like phospholipase family protein [Pseudomonadales bacterium]|nr:patatin-like phospholipase family protein [Pseudomonadales bacterium]
MPDRAGTISMRYGGTPGLVLPGGGARAAYQVGVLKALASLVDGQCVPFRTIAGVSAGAINARTIAEKADDFAGGVEKLERLWTGMASGDVFTMEYSALQGFLSRSAKPVSLLNNAPLRELLNRASEPPGALARQLDNGRLDGLAVTASNYSTGEATTFFQARPELVAWHTRRRHSVATEIRVEHLMASSALPLLFPAEKVGEEYFVDGSLRMTQPLSPVIKMGADRILVIGVRNESQTAHDVERPGIAEIAGYTLDSLFSENLNTDIERMEETNQLIDSIPFWRRRKLRKRAIRVMVIRPSEDLRVVAASHSVMMPRGARLFLRTVGGWGHEWRMPSYLLFEGRFAQALIDLGYRDGLKLRPAVQDFFA